MSVCQEEERAAGHPYPRTCPTCKFGPCSRVKPICPSCGLPNPKKNPYCFCKPSRDLPRIEELLKQAQGYSGFVNGVRKQDLADVISTNKALNEALLRTAASLTAAISLLERTPKAKKAAPSDKMFDQMLADYRVSLEHARKVLKGEE